MSQHSTAAAFLRAELGDRTQLVCSPSQWCLQKSLCYCVPQFPHLYHQEEVNSLFLKVL